MAGLRIEIDQRSLERLRGLGDRMPKVAGVIVRNTMHAWSDQIQLAIRKGAILRRRSGRLATSWGVQAGNLQVKKSGTGATATLSSNVKYAAIQEHGGKVTPKRSQYLAVPLPPALTRAGVPKFPRARDVPDLVPIRSRRGNLLLAKVLGDKLEPWYVLKREVTIPASGYLSKSGKKAERFIPAIADKAIEIEFKRETA
jgi:phage gpG-like protein